MASPNPRAASGPSNDEPEPEDAETRLKDVIDRAAREARAESKSPAAREPVLGDQPKRSG